MPSTLSIHGRHAELASPQDIADGIRAASEVFAKNQVDPLDCANALAKMKRDELLSQEEALLCVIWDEAEEAAFRTITLGWLSRDVDIQLQVS